MIAKTDDPSRRAVEAVMQLKMVILPAPLGPINPNGSGHVDLEGHAIDRAQPRR
jgi:hypothetical protein